jgi:SOS-response transcriptional repressor LexA
MNARMQAVLAFIRDYHAEHGYAPSIREIATGLGLSISNAHRYVRRLKDLGRLTYTEGIARSIVLRREMATSAIGG